MHKGSWTWKHFISPNQDRFLRRWCIQRIEKEDLEKAIRLAPHNVSCNRLFYFIRFSLLSLTLSLSLSLLFILFPFQFLQILRELSNAFIIVIFPMKILNHDIHSNFCHLPLPKRRQIVIYVTWSLACTNLKQMWYLYCWDKTITYVIIPIRLALLNCYNWISDRLFAL